MPAAVFPAGVFYPHPPVVQVKSGVGGPLLHQAGGKLDAGLRRILAASRIVVFQSAVDGLLTATQQGGQLIFVIFGMRLLRRQYLLPRDFHLFGADIIRLDARHLRVLKRQDVGNVNRQKPAGPYHRPMRANRFRQQR